MRWEGGEKSSNVEDRRGVGSATGGGISLIAIVIALAGYFLFGINPLQLMGAMNNAGVGVQQTRNAPQTQANDRDLQFTSTILRDTEVVWEKLFQESGGRYVQPKLVLYSGATNTKGCGMGQAAMGPFYCPADQTVYLDTDFFQTLRTQLGGGGDFAEAYVIAHEIGHHVQEQTGVLNKVNALRGRVSEKEYNAMQVRVELQADCLAGVWASHAHAQRQILEQGDIERAMKTAEAIGDDALQKKSQGYVVPDSFTHGSSEQRVRWFNKGLQTGKVSACDTFNAQQL